MIDRVISACRKVFEKAKDVSSSVSPDRNTFDYCPRCDAVVTTKYREWEIGPPGEYCVECGKDLSVDSPLE